jgi:NTE family protein
LTESKSEMPSARSIGIAFSGGGVRAIAFHSGVVRLLAEKGILNKVGYISSVSGGTLFVGLLFHFAGMKWPTNDEYLRHVFPAVRRTLIEKSLQRSAILRLLRPWNWRLLFSRATVLADTIERLWKIKVPVTNLPSQPKWVINGTTGETGKRFQVSRDHIGDYKTGYSSTAPLKLATAMAISAAYPVGIGPLRLRTNLASWKKRESWNSPIEIEVSLPPFLHLYDGGLYDNLGLEPLFDVETQTLKPHKNSKIERLLVSDSGARLATARVPFVLSPRRVARLLEIALSQVRALRVRSFVHFLRCTPRAGNYFNMGSVAGREVPGLVAHNPGAPRNLLEIDWMCESDVKRVARYPTTLNALRPEDFDAISRHGYETAMWNEAIWP